jgi:hypothetical protein
MNTLGILEAFENQGFNIDRKRSKYIQYYLEFTKKN